MLLATAFLPVQDVPAKFGLLQGTAPDENQPMFNYFEDTFIVSLTSQEGQKPRFDMEHWKCPQKVKQDLISTKNAVENVKKWPDPKKN